MNNFIVSNQRFRLSVRPGKELVTASHLTYFTESDVDTAERVARLYKLHLVLELVVMLEHYLDVPRVSLGVAAR